MPIRAQGKNQRATAVLTLLTVVGSAAAALAAPVDPKPPAARRPAGGLPAATPAPEALRWPGVAPMIDRLASAAERDAAAGDWALARLYRLWNLNLLLAQPDRVAQALETIAKRGRPLVRDHARYLQADLQRKAGETATSRKTIEDLGLLTDGWLIGPFDNPAGGGHETPYGPEQAVDLSAEHVNAGRPLRWRRIRGLAPDGVIEMAHLLPNLDESTAYVAVVVQADRRTRAALRTGSADALKIWLNGREVLDRNVRRFGFMDQDAAGVVLEKGRNLLLLKSSWQGNRGKLFTRLTQPSGLPLRGVSFRADPAAFRRLAKPGRTKPPAVRKVRDALAKRPRGMTSVDWLALKADLIAIMGLYDMRLLPSPAEKLLSDAVRAAPNDPQLRFFLAHRVKGRDPKLAREQLRAAVTADPSFAPAWLALGEMAREGQRLLEAKDAIDTAIEKDPTFGPATITRAVFGFEALGEHVLAVQRLDRAARSLKSAQARVQLGRMRRALDDNRGAQADFEAALAIEKTHRVGRQMLVNLMVDAGNEQRARSLLEAQLALEPWRLQPRLKLIRLTAPVDPERARALLVQTEAEFPGHPEVPVLRADLAIGDGQKPAALAAFDRALTLDPHQPSIRRHRRHVAGGGLDLAEVHGTDAQRLARAPATPAERAFGAVYLTDRTAVELSASGRSTKFRQQVIRLADARVKDALRKHTVSYAPSREDVEILTAEQIRPNGQVIRAASIRDDGRRGKTMGMYVDQRFKVITFGDLAPGDTIHIAYRIDSRGENMFGGFFGDVQAVQGYLPKRDVRYTVTAPSTRPLYHATIRLPDPEVKKTPKQFTLAWQLPQVDSLKYEPLAPPYPGVGRLLTVSTYDAWDTLGRWYARLFREQLELDESARAAGHAAVAGIEDPAEKVRRLYAYVVKNTRYVGIELGIHGWKPYKAAEVHRRRYGDCKDKSTLLSALLRDNGIDATITLVRTADRGRLPPDHATMWAFNHAITYVPELDWYLDPTAEFNGSGELPDQDQGAMALIVHPDGRTKLTTLPVSEPRENLNASTYEARLSRDGRLQMKGEERFFGARAAELRRELQTKDKRQRLLETQLAQVFPGVRISDLEVSDLDALEKPVWYRYRFEVPKYGQVENNRLVIPVALYQHEVSAAYAKLATRQHAVVLDHAWATNNVIRYRLPTGATITKLPEGLNIETPYISLKQTVRRVKGGFETDDTVTLKKREIPAEAYREFRAACLAIDRAMDRKVEIRW